MTRAQIAHAKGISYMVLRHPDGSYTRATNEAELDRALAAGSRAIEIWTQAPSTQAYTDLMNRALDKPAEQVRVTGGEDGPGEFVFKWQTTQRLSATDDDTSPTCALPSAPTDPSEK